MEERRRIIKKNEVRKKNNYIWKKCPVCNKKTKRMWKGKCYTCYKKECAKRHRLKLQKMLENELKKSDERGEDLKNK